MTVAVTTSREEKHKSLRPKTYSEKRVNLVQLTNTYATVNSCELAQELQNIKINENNKIITHHIKDLYVNLPIKNNPPITKFWLNKHNHVHNITEQILYILEIILKPNHFQYNNRFYQPNKGIAIKSPIPTTIAEVYLQYLEKTYVKHCLENEETTYYKRYVDDTLIIFPRNKTDEDTTHNIINNTDEQLEFKISREENETINYLDLSVNRNTKNVNLNFRFMCPCIVNIGLERTN